MEQKLFINNGVNKMNGTMKSQAEYYGDSTKYTGAAGSSTNKWVIEDVFDLVAASGSEKYYELVNDIDFNDHPTYKFGITSSIGSYMRLYGNNHKIRNILIKNSNVFDVYSVRDLIFENVVIFSSEYGLFSIRESGSLLRNVRIGVYFSGASLTKIFNGSRTASCEGCTFNYKGTVNSLDFSDYATYKNCHINLDIKNTNTIVTTMNLRTLTDSYVTGKIVNTDGGNFNLSGTLNGNSYFAVNYASTGVLNSSLNGNSISFVDKDLIQNPGQLTDTSNIKYLTTAQATDPEYLSSIGFVTIATN